MNIAEMHSLFRNLTNSGDSSDLSGFLPYQIDQYLNMAIETFLEEQTSPAGSILWEGFESNQQRLHTLSPLHVKAPERQPAISPSILSNGVYEVTLATPTLLFGLYRITRVRVDIEKDNCIKQKVRAHMIQTDDEDMVFNKPDFDFAFVPMKFGLKSSLTGASALQNALYLYTDALFTVTSVYVDYLKTPNRVFFDGYTHIDGKSAIGSGQIHCDLYDSHEKIVQRAARLAAIATNHIPGTELKTLLIKEGRLISG